MIIMQLYTSPIYSFWVSLRISPKKFVYTVCIWSGMIAEHFHEIISVLVLIKTDLKNPIVLNVFSIKHRDLIPD